MDSHYQHLNKPLQFCHSAGSPTLAGIVMASKPTHLQSLEQLKALASPVRQTIWHLVTILQPVAPHTLQKHMGLERHALYYHLRLLEQCGLVTKTRDSGTSVSYKTEAKDTFIDPSVIEEWREVSTSITVTSLRRLSARLETAIGEAPPEEGSRRHQSGFMTLFLDDEGRQKLRDKLNEFWDELVEMQHVPEEGEKPYFLGFGFAPESYGHD
jgi:predicted transcriptional regulator